MKLPWIVQRKTETPAEQKLEEIRNILFPVPETETKFDGKKEIKYFIDRSVDMNLDAALIDLQEGNNDKICHDTINSVIKSLIQVRQILNAYSELDSDSQYVIVDNPKETQIDPERFLPQETD